MDANGEGDIMMKPPAITASPSWPCANCQTTVSTGRCPTCHGIQVRVVVDDHTQNEGKGLITKAWLERLSPALALRTPTQTPTQQLDDDDDDDDGLFRPVDPVASILTSAPSPIVDSQQKASKLKEIEDSLRLRKRPLLVTDMPGTKKTKLLSAA